MARVLTAENKSAYLERQLAAAQAEVERLNRRVAHCHNWYATRLEPIKDIAKKPVFGRKSQR